MPPSSQSTTKSVTGSLVIDVGYTHTRSAGLRCWLAAFLLDRMLRRRSLRADACIELIIIPQWYNIMTGAQFFTGLISDNGGNLLKSIGQYNGWREGLTIVSFHVVILYFETFNYCHRRKQLLLHRPIAAHVRTTSTSTFQLYMMLPLTG